MCLTPNVLHILQYRLRVPPDDTRPIDEVLDTLEGHVKAQTNEALRRRELFSCKQQVRECFNDFYVRVKTLVEAEDICKSSNSQCEETQMKQVLLMGVQDQELVKEMISTNDDKYQDPRWNRTAMLRFRGSAAHNIGYSLPFKVRLRHLTLQA